MAAGQPQDAEAGAEALLGVRLVAQDDVDEDRGGRPDASGALAQHLRRELGITAMAGRGMWSFSVVAPASPGAARRWQATRFPLRKISTVPAVSLGSVMRVIPDLR